MQQTVSTIEARLTALEREVSRLRQLQFGKDWLERVMGSFKDDPAFGEIIELGREIRRSDRPVSESHD